MALREAHLRRMRGGTFDTLIIGGGINGAVTAASLAGRGASVALVDRGDFANFTSQASSNLVWGGFKYLENYELYLVWKLCRSRNRLMDAYPDNIKEIAFYAALDETSPYKPWFAGLGAFGYWLIGQFGTKAPRVLSREKIEREEPAVETTTVLGGIEYHDGILIDNDARFVFSFVRSAIEAGAAAANYVELVSAERSGDRWIAHLRDVDSGEEFTTTASTIVNAAGPFVDELNTAVGAHVVAPHRVLEGHPPRGATPDDDRARQGAGLLRRHPATVLRDPDGPPIGDRHDRHARRHSVQRGHRRRHRVPPRADQRAARPRAAARTRRHHRRTLRGPTARREGGQRRPLGGRLDEVEPQARRRGRSGQAGRHDLRRQAHRLPERGRGGRRRDRAARRAAREGPAQLVRRAGSGHARRVLPAGPADATRRSAREGRHRAADRPPVAPLRTPGVRHARRHPRGSDDGRGHHGLGRLPAGRAAHGRVLRDDHEARGLHAPPLEDRTRRPRRRHRQLARTARGRRDPVRRRCRPSPRGVLRRRRPRARRRSRRPDDLARHDHRPPRPRPAPTTTAADT